MRKKALVTDFKTGTVAIVGRPNAGKSTLINALVGQKVAAVSPRPQTTRGVIQAFYEDDRAQIFFLDTPGLFHAGPDSQAFNQYIQESLEDADIAMYVVDHTREWGREEEAMWAKVQTHPHLVIAINKIDTTKPSFLHQYKQQFKNAKADIVEISAYTGLHLPKLINSLIEKLPSGNRTAAVDSFVTPLLSQNSQEYLEELLKEKIFLATTEEVPYKTVPHIDDIMEDESKKRLTIRGHIQVLAPRYKGMIIGAKGKKIKEISMALRKELELATDKQVVVKLEVTED